MADWNKIKDGIAKGVKSFFDDVSRKWEEFIYGRTVSPRAQSITFDMQGAKKPLSEQFGWTRRDEGTREPDALAHDRDKTAKEVNAPDRGIDL